LPHARNQLSGLHHVILTFATTLYSEEDAPCPRTPHYSPNLKYEYAVRILNLEKRHSYDTRMQTTARSSVRVDAKPTSKSRMLPCKNSWICCRTYRNGRRQITLSHGSSWGRIATRREMAAPIEGCLFSLLAVRSMPGAVRSYLVGAYHLPWNFVHIVIAAHHVTLRSISFTTTDL
jgi:hypothetical protein